MYLNRHIGFWAWQRISTLDSLPRTKHQHFLNCFSVDEFASSFTRNLLKIQSLTINVIPERFQLFQSDTILTSEHVVESQGNCMKKDGTNITLSELARAIRQFMPDLETFSFSFVHCNSPRMGVWLYRDTLVSLLSALPDRGIR